MQTGNNVIRSISFGALTWVGPMLLSLIATPFIVRALGLEGYGIYALVLGIISYSFNFGVGRAAAKYVAEYQATEDRQKIGPIVSSSLIVSIALGAAAVLLIGFLAPWLVVSVLGIEARFQDGAINALYIAAGIIVVTLINQLFGSVLQGLHRFDLYSKLFNLTNFAVVLGNLTLAVAGYGLEALLAWNLGVLMISVVVHAVSAKRLLADINLFSGFDRESLRKVFLYTGGVVGYQLLGNVLLLFERGYITRVLGSDQLTYYVVAMAIGLYLHGFSTSLLLAIAPVASEQNQDLGRLKKLYDRSTKLIGVIVVFVTAVLLVSGGSFLTLWMGQQFADEATAILKIHTITFSLLSIAGVAWFMREGLGVPKHNLYVSAICFVVTLSLMLLTTKYGNVGMALSRLAGFSVMFFSIFTFERWLFGKFDGMFWLRNSFRLLVAAILAATLLFFSLQTFSLAWPAYIVAVACSGLLYCGILWVLGYLDQSEKNAIFSAIRSRTA
ncbi:MAG: oligosaccharide flippase family protein [Acidobacteria bacterium]|nr:oligosaccharide flippase family protein [Acidobacteriota bacterium]